MYSLRQIILQDLLLLTGKFRTEQILFIFVNINICILPIAIKSNILTQISRLFAPFLRGDEKEKLISSLDNRYADNPGECILFDWIELIKDHIQQFESSLPSTVISDDQLESVIHDQIALDISMKSCDISAANEKSKHKSDGTNVVCPEIYTGDTIEDRKSVFQGHFASVQEVQQVPMVLEKLRENKKIKNAHHPTMYAYRIQQKGKSSIFGLERHALHPNLDLTYILNIIKSLHYFRKNRILSRLR